MKRIVAVFLALLVSLSVLCCICEAREPLLHDEAGLLTEKEAADLTRKLEDLSEDCGVVIAVLTVNDMGSKWEREYADDYYDEHYYPEDGILLLVDMGTRAYYETTYGTCEDIFEYHYEELEDTFVDSLSYGNYYSAFCNFADKASSMVQWENIGIGKKMIVQVAEDFFPSLILSVIFGLIISLILTGKEKKKLKSVKMQNNASQYVRDDSFNLKNQRDLFLYSNVTRVRIQSSSSGSSGGSSHHTSSSGSSHGGHGGHF